ncbi:helix-hairpin-helix domain-containing protein [Melissococcus plutonius]|uniref:Late competence protein comEA, DNA receptor n=2 Tax=Melissococcus plutonius TaxID=33970 RepID=A0A2Z5Y1R7_9ENTE|nr:helix-hairpin-helix domain-containing protein [Melissococcus plutonius]MCV2499380.1 helix-hairpin-helix domain-containing protein [Melissococcus plutonius]MCV2500612.1 helix-hairpin-helix domain-containing protein [Melissococcus plutonius]MCV2505057.1 helix-hairpin-helix domain-containing protein [Melissococcus plutonius]MCV2507963.1 helix-hairpin-helix domain-containing protein [Melissococcus plutonius]MCV2520305.1 helix-hairpin-helix domain-containing protein [Melissococcus plutonius]
MERCQKLLKSYLSFISVGFIIIIFIALISINYTMSKSEETVKQQPTFDISKEEKKVEIDKTEKATQQNESPYLDIKGAVKAPGMYKGKINMRVWDAIALAGGLTEEAETKQVNFSQKIADQMVIYIPIKGEEIQEISYSTPEKTNQLNKKLENEKVNLNQADEQQLQQLNGIGLKKAQEIIRYREEEGEFKTIEDLENVSGIGAKTVESLKDAITVS